MTKSEMDRRYYLSNREHIKRATAFYAKTEKGKIVQQLAQAKYRKTKGSRDAKARYKRTRKGRITTRRSERSLAAKARHHRYESTPKGRAASSRKVRKHILKSKYGLTVERYNELVRAQNGQCEICNKKPNRLVVDHKVQGSYRGLLCSNCNVGIGMLQDSVLILLSAIQYLKKSSNAHSVLRSPRH